MNSIPFGWMLISGGALGLAYVILKTRQPFASNVGAVETMPKARPTDKLSIHGDRKGALEVVERDQTITLLGENRELAIISTITLSAMTETNGKWHETGVEYRALEVAGDVWIFKIPGREGGDPIWVKATRVAAPSTLQAFFKGDDNAKGPARLFKENGQTDPVPFVLPKAFKDATKYEVVDIGRFKTTVDGKCESINTDDMYPIVTARKQGGGAMLFYLDPRKDMAHGTGGLFKGEEFEPDVEISQLL